VWGTNSAAWSQFANYDEANKRSKSRIVRDTVLGKRWLGDGAYQLDHQRGGTTALNNGNDADKGDSNQWNAGLWARMKCWKGVKYNFPVLVDGAHSLRSPLDDDDLRGTLVGGADASNEVWSMRGTRV